MCIAFTLQLQLLSERNRIMEISCWDATDNGGYEEIDLKKAKHTQSNKRKHLFKRHLLEPTKTMNRSSWSVPEILLKNAVTKVTSGVYSWPRHKRHFPKVSNFNLGSNTFPPLWLVKSITKVTKGTTRSKALIGLTQKNQTQNPRPLGTRFWL